MLNKIRKIEHRKNDDVERYIEELARYLKPVQDQIESEKEMLGRYPVVFVVGCARSGTTILHQSLSSTGDFCYPSNIISRFYFAPYIGSIVHRLFIDLDKKGEFFPDTLDLGYTSNLGKTKGADSPNEFWYFWRQYFKFNEVQQLSENELSKVDSIGFLKGLRSIPEVFKKPLILKGMIMNWNLDYLANLVPESCFVFVKRSVEFNAQSLLISREKYFGNRHQWYSFKPPEYQTISSKEPEEQVVEQVLCTNLGIERSLSKVEKDRVLHVEYEKLCENPRLALSPLFERIGLSPSKIELVLESQNEIRVDNSTWTKICEASK